MKNRLFDCTKFSIKLMKFSGKNFRKTIANQKIKKIKTKNKKPFLSMNSNF